ncbi:FtsX-like permease family protein [Streptomyces sp. NPDC001515]
MSLFTGWRAALRMARRDALRAKGRSALVVAMIALPVLGVTAADVTYRSADTSEAELLTARMGSADALFTDPGLGPLEQMPDGDMYDAVGGSVPEGDIPPIDMRAALPEGARALTVRSVPATVTTAYGLVGTDITELRISDAMVRGRVELIRGAFPHGTDEMAATEPFMKSAGLHVGSRTTVNSTGRTYTITGVVEEPSDLNAKGLYADPGAVIAPWQKAADRDPDVLPPNTGSVQWLVTGAGGSGVDWDDVLAANRVGALVVSRQVVLDPPPASEIPLARSITPYKDSTSAEVGADAVTVVAMAVLEIVLLAGPAFAVGARRSRRQLGLIDTCGGDRRHIRAVVLAGGIVLGSVGAVTGVAAGLLLTVAFRPTIEEWAGQRFGSLVLDPGELLTIALLGLVTGVLAALAPAIVASRQSVLESLTGRRGVRRGSRVLPVAGACVLALGTAVAVYGGTSDDTRLVAGGSVLAELGLLGCIPVIVGLLGRLGRRLPLSPRMALRDAARNRGRTAPAVAAVMAAVAGSVALATYMSSTMAESDYRRVPMLAEGTMVLSASDEDSAARLPLARAAVERTMTVTGRRADYARVWAGSDCNVFYEDDASGCGSMALVKPTGKGHTCPLQAKGAKELAARLSSEEHRTLMRTPACVDEHVSAGSFGTDENNIVVGGPDLLRTYVKLDDPAAAAALEAGTPVLLNRAYAKDGEVTLKAVHTYNPKDTENRKLHPGPARRTTDRLRVYVADAPYATTPGIRMIMPRKTAERIGLHTQEGGSVYAVPHRPSDAEDQRVAATIEEAGGGVWLQTDPGPGDRDDTTLLILTLFAGVVTLGAAAITTGLAKADAEADLTTLSAVGAPPRVRRALSGFQCMTVAFTGVLLGTVAGLVPAVAVRLTDLGKSMEAMRVNPMESAYTPIVMPWTAIGVLAVAVPLLAGLLAAVFSRSRPALARRAG